MAIPRNDVARKRILRGARRGRPAPADPQHTDVVEVISAAAAYRNWYKGQKTVPGPVQAFANAWAARKDWRP